MTIKNALYESLHKEIENSRYIYDLEFDWDQEGAHTISRELWEIAIKFLISYAEYVYANYGVEISTPYIDPVCSGSIDFSWRRQEESQKSGMLCNIRFSKENIPVAGYYGYVGNYENEIKDIIPCRGIHEPLALWMKNLAKD